MITTLQVEVRTVYGEQRFYPLCDRAKTFAEIAGTKTVSSLVLRQAEALGFEVSYSTRLTYVATYIIPRMGIK